MKEARSADGDRQQDGIVYDFLNDVLPQLGYAEWVPRRYEGAYGRRKAVSAWRASSDTPKAMIGLAAALSSQVSRECSEHRRVERERRNERERHTLEASLPAGRAAAASGWDRTAVRARELLEAEAALVQKFVEVTLRKVRLLDEYGDENLGALDEEAARVVGKLRNKYAEIATGGLLEGLLLGQLRDRFLSHHQQHPAGDIGPIMQLDGEGYEAQVMTWLRAIGAKDVQGTPRTGDQGGDVLFSWFDHRVVVQCKRYKDRVSNKAVQEVHAAKAFYACTDAWVVTTGTATPGARQAAQVTGVKLVELATTRSSLETVLAGFGRGDEASPSSKKDDP